MSDWDLGGVFCNDLNLPGGDDSQNGGQNVITPEIAQRKFREFIRTFRRVNSNVFEYREKLLRNVRRGIHAINVNLKDLKFFGLQDLVMERPGVFSCRVREGGSERRERSSQGGRGDTEHSNHSEQRAGVYSDSSYQCVSREHIGETS